MRGRTRGRTDRWAEQALKRNRGQARERWGRLGIKTWTDDILRKSQSCIIIRFVESETGEKKGRFRRRWTRPDRQRAGTLERSKEQVRPWSQTEERSQGEMLREIGNASLYAKEEGRTKTKKLTKKGDILGLLSP